MRIEGIEQRPPKKYSGAWNFGPDDSSHLTVATMADRLIKYWGSGAWDDLSDPKALHEAKLLKLNCDKAHAALKWSSVLTIDECLRMTAEWYKEFYSGTQTKDMHQFCVAQIIKYEGAAVTKSIGYAQSELKTESYGGKHGKRPSGNTAGRHSGEV